MASEANTFLATLDLVCPPIPNSAVSFITKNQSYVRIMRQSDFYMICGRAAAVFGDFEFANKEGHLHFSIELKGTAKTSGFIRITELPVIDKSEDDLIVQLRYGDDFIHVYAGRDDDSIKMVAAFNPDEILMRKGRKESTVGGFDNYLEIATYDLLYVGIASAGDSYDRLFAKGHHARTQILSDEPQRFPGARVSDEIYLFLFTIDPLFIRTFGPTSDIEDDDLDFSYDPKQMVADAEKAFVSLLKPKYNKQLYPNYPKSKDGFHGEGYTSYGYSISEGMSFRTQYGAMKGGRERHMTLSNDADSIIICGDEVKLHISGVDFDIRA